MRVDLNTEKKNAVFRILAPAFSIQVSVLTLLSAKEYSKKELERAWVCFFLPQS